MTPGVEAGYVPAGFDDWDDTEFDELDDMWEYDESTCNLEDVVVCESCM